MTEEEYQQQKQQLNRKISKVLPDSPEEQKLHKELNILKAEYAVAQESAQKESAKARVWRSRGVVLGVVVALVVAGFFLWDNPPSVILLRSNPKTLSLDEIKKMVRERDFREWRWNPGGDFPNSFEEQTLRGDKVVIDSTSGLMWQQGGSSNAIMWQNAQNYVEQLNQDQYAGFSDWRLPTIEELASLVEAKEQSNGLYIDPIFDKKQFWCWSADNRLADSDLQLAAWNVGFLVGNVGLHLLDAEYYIRAVRSVTN